jgi:hypothetical protein
LIAAGQIVAYLGFGDRGKLAAPLVDDAFIAWVSTKRRTAVLIPL